MVTPSGLGTIRQVRNTEFAIDSTHREWKRKIKPNGERTDWEPLSPTLTPSELPLQLFLVLESQAAGEPDHWSLFVAREGEIGQAYQVTGDATYMTYIHYLNINLLESESYSASYALGDISEDQHKTVRKCAETEPPPRAASRTEVKENCQGWALRVLKRLSDQGIVSTEWVTSVEDLMEPV